MHVYLRFLSMYNESDFLYTFSLLAVYVLYKRSVFYSPSHASNVVSCLTLIR